MPKLLLVEDDLELAQMITDRLAVDNFAVENASSAEDALVLLNNYSFDVIILDWELEDSDLTGLDVCKRFRQGGGVTPIIFLTGRNELDCKEKGLDAGADDYLVKPFEFRELGARLRSVLRRPYGMTADELKVSSLTLQPDKRILIDGELTVRLTPLECNLIEFMMRHTDRLYSAKALLDSVWPADSYASEETVRTCMKTLRSKLSKLRRSDLIKTVLGSGYILETQTQDSAPDSKGKKS